MNNNSNAVTESLLQDRPIGELQASIAPPTPHSPDNLARRALDDIALLPQPLGQGREWCLQPMTWEATAMKHLPLYFDEPNLERLGYYYGYPADGSRLQCKRESFEYWFGARLGLVPDAPPHQIIQPFVSAGNFYGRVLGIPYMIVAYSPYEEIYTLGEDRPGSPVPYRKHYVPLSFRGLSVQGELLKDLRE